MRRGWLLTLALCGCHREPTREQVTAPIYRDHRPLPELGRVVTERCDDATTIVVTRQGVHVDATAIGSAIPWHKRRDALPEDLRLDWPLASRNVVRLRDGLYPLEGDHEQRVLRDVLDRAAALQKALPAAEGEHLSVIVTVAADVPIETMMRTYFEVLSRVEGTVAVATAAGCVTTLFPRAADGRARVRITAIGDRYATTSCKSDAEGKLAVGPERWTADEVRTSDLGGVPEYCAAPLDRTLDVLNRYLDVASRAGEPLIPFVTAARPR